MKKHLLCTALGALVLNTGASADIEYNLAVALTASYTDAALRERDENGRFIRGADLVFENEWSTERGAVSTDFFEEGGRIVVERISNREILEEFIVEGGIDTTIRGWALKLAIPSDGGGEEGEAIMYATYGDQFHEIPFEIGIGAYAEQFRYNFSESYNANTDRSVVRERGSARYIQEMFGLMQVNEYQLSFASILTVNETLRFLRSSDEILRVWFPSSIQMNSIVGNLSFSSDSEPLSFAPVDDDDDFYDDDDDYEFSDVLQGRMNASRGRLVFLPR